MARTVRQLCALCTATLPHTLLLLATTASELQTRKIPSAKIHCTRIIYVYSSNISTLLFVVIKTVWLSLPRNYL
jgi:hypothetical protein